MKEKDLPVTILPPESKLVIYPDIAGDSNISSSKFRGFGKDVSYIPSKTAKGSICQACPNLCQLHYIEVPDAIGKRSKRLIYGDACDRYQKKEKNFVPGQIEDLLKGRLELLQKEYPLAPQAEKLLNLNSDRTIGLPAGLFYWESFPFWGTFLKSLGLSIVVSDPSSRNTLEQANHVTNVDSCLPLKMYFGLVGGLINNPEVTDIFLPSMFTYSPLNDLQGISLACPLVTGASHMVKAPYSSRGKNTVEADEKLNHGKRFLMPEFVFDTRYAVHKMRKLSRSLAYGKDAEIVKQLYDFAGSEFNVSKKMVENAYIAAKEAQSQFIANKREKGRKILEELAQKNEHAIVFFGRPYNTLDAGMNMKLDFEIRKLGWQVIPYDYLPLEDAKRTQFEYNNDTWYYQGKLLAGANLIKHNPLLHGIFITNFKCGADGFILKDMERTLTQPGKLMVLEIDDLVNGTGYRTRIDAFIRSIILANHKAQHSGLLSENTRIGMFEASIKEVKQKRFTKDDLTTKRVMVPLMSDHSIFLAGALRAFGIDSMHFPPMKTKEMEVGRALSNGKECLPFTTTAGEIIVGLLNEVENGYDPKNLAILWAKTDGPCRFSQYSFSHQYNIDQTEELRGAKIINLALKKTAFFNLFTPGLKLGVMFLKAYLIGDYVQQVLHQTRPYEIHTNEIKPLKKEYLEKVRAIENEDMGLYFPPNALDGDYRKVKLTDLIYQVYIRKIADAMGDGKDFNNMVREFLAEIKKVPVNRARKKPLIGLIGEIYLRFNPFTNGDIIRQLELLGAEVHLAPISELLFNGTQAIKGVGDSLFGKFRDNLKYKFLKKIDDSIVQLFEDALSRPTFGQGRDADTVAKYGRQYTGNYCGGEGPLTLGAIEDYARHGADGVIMIGPMGCMPNIIYKGLFERVKDFLPENCKDMPLIEITISESLNFKNMQTRIEPFINQAKDYLKTKKNN